MLKRKRRIQVTIMAIKSFFRHLLTPITVMVIPHSNEKTYTFKLPSVGIVTLIVTWIAFSAYIISVGVTTRKYHEIKEQADFYYSQFIDVKATIYSLKKAEQEFRNLLLLKDKEKIFENLDTVYSGSIDMELLRRQIEESQDAVGEIKAYLKTQKSIYYATPRGAPVGDGRMTSGFGWREHPRTHRNEFHSGLDLAVNSGTPVRATADGIVSFAGWSGGSGKLVVIEHGFGYTTCFAHNKSIVVSRGDKVKRGDVISHSGSTGDSTGPHVHYEVWLDNKPIDPSTFLNTG